MRVTATHQTNSQGVEEQGYCMEGEDDFTATPEGQTADFGSIDGLNNTGEGKLEFEAITKDGKISQEEADRLNQRSKKTKEGGNFNNGHNIDLQMGANEMDGINKDK